MSSELDHHGPVLPGYTLSTRLGAGGYGEVWLAHAPGGLTKAVKFIFGSYNDKRAEHELRALQRIKEVRHPFLLSLERIEVVDGRLVIVTELADESLKDRFDDCVKKGLPGVPRAELLGLLRDAADALDYLCQKHSLQHLDVKPENLLLLAGHVKVADFGLVKDVGKSQASLVGGLTPLYSAPEVFQGSPSIYSDQYSLAVLYQEMLTGMLPFPGVTAAELTMQHLHDEPDLSPLPPSDRYVISRALSKDPANRFENCADLIAALTSAGVAAPGHGSDSWGVSSNEGGATLAAADEDVRRPRAVTELFATGLDRPERGNSMLLEAPALVEAPARALPPAEFDVQDFTARPTLVIGIGGAAAGVLQQLRQRISRQFGDEGVPAVQLLLLDSDPKAIARAQQGGARTALKPDETLALPLRRPQEYREQSSRLTRWLSRRWLYNIPRSLRTDGIRPLGRLAFADHARQVVQRIRMSLNAAAATESIELSRQRTGLAFQSATPRVYVVASISGGAGSGMSLDVGYAVRAALDKMGAADAPVVGVFLHAAGGDARHCDLAKVNAYAWLTEYNHFHQPGGAFPGDESCGLPALESERRAFNSAYLVELEAAPLDDQPLEAAGSVAEYVYLDALTPAQSFFAACRREDDAPTGAASLRTFALHKTPAASDAVIDWAASVLSREVVLSWAGGDVAAGQTVAPDGSVRDTNQIVQGAATLIGQLQLKLDGLASHAKSLVEAQFGGDQRTFVAELLAAAGADSKSGSTLAALRAVDRLFACPQEQQTGYFVLGRPLEAIVSPLSMKLASDLSQWVLRKLDDRQERLAGAQRSAQWLVDHLKRVDADAARLADGLARQAAALVDELRRDSRADVAPPEAVHARAIAYFRMRIDCKAVYAAGIIARRLLAELKLAASTVAELGRHLKHLAVNLPGGAGAASDAPSGALPAALAERLPLLVEEIDSQVQSQFIAEQGGLLPAVMGNSRIRAQMLATLGKLARDAAEQLASRPDVLRTAFAQRTPSDGSGVDYDNSQDLRLPRFLGAGGDYRLLTVAPAACSAAASNELRSTPLGDQAAALVAAAGSDLVTVCEGWRLPLPLVALNLINRRCDYADFAARVQTRSDVRWSSLVSPVAAAAPVVDAFAGLGGDSVSVTQVLQ